VERTYTATINNLGTYNKMGYEYSDMSYSFADKGDGYGLGGDSGSGLLYNGDIVGVYTRAQSMYFDAAAMPCELTSGMCDVEAIYQGGVGSGLALNQEDLDWLTDAHVAVPEPGTWILLILGLSVFSLRRRFS
jgi:hypothetical protein